MTASRKKKTAKEIIIDDQFCKGCNLCIEVCPRKVFGRSNKRSHAGYPMPQAANPGCSVCFLCEMTCPDLAITVVEENP
jgi:2-oxoglutarate ferredoxin oxidoreductase subunit delta